MRGIFLGLGRNHYPNEREGRVYGELVFCVTGVRTLNILQWHDTLWQARQILFLVLPPIIHLLPASNPAPSPLSSLPYLTRLADQTLARIQLLEYTRGASLREPELRAAAEAWWERERTEGSWGSSDAQVREIAEKLGLGVEERGALRSRAHVAAEALKGGFKPSEYF